MVVVVVDWRDCRSHWGRCGRLASGYIQLLGGGSGRLVNIQRPDTSKANDK